MLERSLERLMMSHNNVGRSGARAVFMALRQRARPGVDILVDLQSCELGSESGGDLFDMCSPSGRCEMKVGGSGKRGGLILGRVSVAEGYAS